MRRAVGARRSLRPKTGQGETISCQGGLRRVRAEVANYGVAVVYAAGATYLLKLGMQQLLKPATVAPSARVVKLDIEGLNLLKQRIHGRVASCGLTFELSRGPRRLGLALRPMMNHRGLAAKLAFRGASALGEGLGRTLQLLHNNEPLASLRTRGRT